MTLEAEKNAQTELLAQGHTLVKLENEVQMQISTQRPRNEKKILNESLNELEIYPSCASEAMYNKPVGKNEQGKMTYAEGLSIRAAESLGNRWDNSAYGVDKVAEDDDSVTLVAVFLDYEKNTRHVLQKRVSKSYRKRTGQIQRYTPDRFDIVMAANQSKLLREVILRSLPAGLKKEYESKAKKLLSGEDINTRIKKMVSVWKELGISKEQLTKLAGKDIQQFNHADITSNIGTYNAIKDGDITIESVFGKKEIDDKKEPESVLKVKSQEEDIPKGCFRVTTGIARITVKKGKIPHRIVGEANIIYTTESDSIVTFAETAFGAGIKVTITHKGGRDNEIESIKMIEG